MNDLPVLGGSYVDGVTGFTGTATGLCTFLHEEPQVQLENESAHRWFPVVRVEAAA